VYNVSRRALLAKHLGKMRTVDARVFFARTLLREVGGNCSGSGSSALCTVITKLGNVEQFDDWSDGSVARGDVLLI
jgi:hypothetical protein